MPEGKDLSVLLEKLKQFSFAEGHFQLAIITKTSRAPISYKAFRLDVEDVLKVKLRTRLQEVVKESNHCSRYDFITPEQDEGMVFIQEMKNTDFELIKAEIDKGDDNAKITEEDELSKAYAYVIQIELEPGNIVYAFRRVPEKWNVQKLREKYFTIFKNHQLLSIEAETVFKIDRNIDFFCYDSELIIIDKKNFERGLNFRRGMEEKRDRVYKQFEDLELFVDIEPLKKKCSSNLRYLRKLATIENLGYYKDSAFLKKAQLVAKKESWKIIFNKKGQIEVNDENLDDVLSVLVDGRLKSLLTAQTYDVDAKRTVN